MVLSSRNDAGGPGPTPAPDSWMDDADSWGSRRRNPWFDRRSGSESVGASTGPNHPAVYSSTTVGGSATRSPNNHESSFNDAGAKDANNNNYSHHVRGPAGSRRGYGGGGGRGEFGEPAYSEPIGSDSARVLVTTSTTTTTTRTTVNSVAVIPPESDQAASPVNDDRNYLGVGIEADLRGPVSLWFVGLGWPCIILSLLFNVVLAILVTNFSLKYKAIKKKCYIRVPLTNDAAKKPDPPLDSVADGSNNSHNG